MGWGDDLVVRGEGTHVKDILHWSVHILCYYATLIRKRNVRNHRVCYLVCMSDIIESLW